MSKPIGSIFFLFLFSMLLSNSEGHLKFADGKVAQNSSSWCIAKYSANDTELANIIVSVCYFLLDDCNIIQPGGSCFIPNTLINHASVVMNQFYAKIGRSYCSDLITVTDPSYGSCKYA
ncbi:PREDICTED: glucan endo-1,3-beta-glucosidase-like [Lupinus angustifolius]|uniref:glucan endo-1,3-beta-glucosidase-like n=1 Tax=Lupinus angustifolius TaxID=3871 RepID=UPI00092F22BA|nr:PREDICTED: glucan endo-1,3-beta-glucosidase-like [Lupinus angustifolius]